MKKEKTISGMAAQGQVAHGAFPPKAQVDGAGCEEENARL
jgi:hypothetical protein